MADIQVLPDGRIELKVLPGVALKPKEAKKELVDRGCAPAIAGNLITSALKKREDTLLF